jgi:two-component system cell cycle response regulator
MSTATTLEERAGGAGVVELLFVEDERSLAHAIQESLATAKSPRFRVTHAPALADALRELGERDFDAILLDLTLPDARELDAPLAIRKAAPDVPIVVLTGCEDDRLVDENARAGVQDYLLKREVSWSLLVRTLRYAVERNRLLREVKHLSLKDELTGFYNRRGFFTVGEQQLKIAERMEKSLLVLYIDVDGLKQCNDTWGHNKGDALLRRVARVLNRTFRESDVIGRLGGDEFAVLSLDASKESSEAVLARLHRNLGLENQIADESCDVSVSIGMSMSVPLQGTWLGDLVKQADEKMYAEKRRKKSEASIAASVSSADVSPRPVGRSRA